ncbi:molybdate ABC transporter substrate-binding protein [Nocardioides sp. GY 10113]|uniref:molybdate ABC transporter substrate-binding protein n=1 Tax=Nocardioides sp. GY 10113 TaxID=2569761 RepID=UPI0010A923A6|nr:molybdate ABC transporter substrate-binding protein [Nocardioides sp. GY 10113]TIC86320.1 molybdate ABC transporter substrate-binding protein [Nocardioides sp. GY 10113]
MPHRPRRRAGRPTRRTLAALLALGATLPALAGCGAAPETVRILAAASLTDVFGDLATEFEAEHGVDVALSFGSSTDLAEQAADGAPGDVLATADEASMAVATAAGAAAHPRPLASNVLVIVTPPGNPARVTSLDDLAHATWVRCADEAPCGRVATAVLADHAVDAEPASLEVDVRAALDKVTSGEADAALVYATDAAAAGADVETVTIPGAEREQTTYLVSELDQSTDPDLARAWVDLVTGASGRAALRRAGFELP